MLMLIKTFAAVAAGTVLATNAFAQSAGKVGEVSPYVAIENEAPPKLIVDPTPLAAGLAHNIVWIQYHAENVRIVPVFGAGALNVSPRIGHLHVHIDDLPWGWVEATPDNNTISKSAAIRNAANAIQKSKAAYRTSRTAFERPPQGGLSFSFTSSRMSAFGGKAEIGAFPENVCP